MEVVVVVTPSESDPYGFSAEVEAAVRVVSGPDVVERLEDRERGILADAAVVVLAVMVAGELAVWLAACWSRLRRVSSPLTVVDCSGDRVRVEVRDDVEGMRGVLIVRQRSGEEVRIEETADDSTLLELLKRALG